jgi:hypothetical protein
MVNSNCPTAYCRAIVTVRCGPSLEERPGSFVGEPMVKLPAGTTIICGQFAHSLNVSFGLNACLAAMQKQRQRKVCLV